MRIVGLLKPLPYGGGTGDQPFELAFPLHLTSGALHHHVIFCRCRCDKIRSILQPFYRAQM